MWSKSAHHSAAPTHVEIAPVFIRLADEWERDTQFTSSLTEWLIHPAFRRILALGPNALPLLLQRFRSDPIRWFWALEPVAGENPAEGIEDLDQVVDTWLSWAESRGIHLP